MSGIIGIDFGARSSSAAFSCGENSSTRALRVLNQWPAATRRPLSQFPSDDEVESIVYYDLNLKIVGWSEDKHEVFRPEGGMQYGIYVVPDFQARLFPPNDYPEEVQGAFLAHKKTADDIAVDYLRNLRLNVLAQVQSHCEAPGTAQAGFHVVMTTPAFWDGEAQGNLRKIARAAGFTEERGEKLEFVSGLEAALRYAEYEEPSNFTVGDTIMVLDCGGNLVEATTFEVRTGSPLSLERRSKVSVASCGSAEVTRRFLEVVSKKIEKTGFPSLGRTVPRMRLRCKTQFEKEVMMGLGNTTFQAPPGAPDAFWVADLRVDLDCTEADLVEGYMTFTEEEVYPCFDLAIERTLNLVKEQVEAVQEQNKRLNGCLLVGGFNRCAYYSRNVRAGIESQGLRIIQHEHEPAGFAKGAVLSGLNRA
ncbi:hypothetical protein BJX64DRAFT_301594 [Aspergillus heterothallicus]